MTQNNTVLPEEQLGPAERMLNIFRNPDDHLFHNRPGIVENGKWRAATREEIEKKENIKAPGINEPVAVRLYQTIADIFLLNNELAARFASYVYQETDWKDLKVMCAAFMLVQSKKGLPVFNQNSNPNQKPEVAFYDDDYREIGEAMIKIYRKGWDRMMNPESILKISEILSLEGVQDINKKLGFCSPYKKKEFVGRYYRAVQNYLEYRELNLPLLEGAVTKGGFRKKLQNLARISGYKPKSQRFFEILRWEQRQSKIGARTIGLENLNIKKLTFEGLNEKEICEKIVKEKIGYKTAMGMLGKGQVLTPAIMVSLLDSLSDKDLRILSPTLEGFGLLSNKAIRARWEKALKSSEDQRASNVALNMKKKENIEALQQASTAAVQKVVQEATKEADIYIGFLIDKSGSMEGAIEESKKALGRILQAFPIEKLAIATFDSMGTRIKLKASTQVAVEHALSGIKASGGTSHEEGYKTLFADGTFRPPKGSDFILFVVGDEAGEAWTKLNTAIERVGVTPSAVAHIVSCGTRWGRGHTLRDYSKNKNIPYTEVKVEDFSDPYSVTRVLKGILESTPLKGETNIKKETLVEKVMKTPLLVRPY